jgi:transposase-like protein
MSEMVLRAINIASNLPQIISLGIGIPSRRMIADILDDEEQCLIFLFRYNLFSYPGTVPCKRCGGMVSETLKTGTKYSFKCKRKNCRTANSILDFTFFEQCRLPVNNILEIGYLWLTGATTTAIIAQLDHSSATICNWIGYIKQAVAFDLSTAGAQALIGGPGIIVEIDESKFGKRKYHRGHLVEGVWIVGGVERTDARRCFAVPVEDRSIPTLLSIILNNVAEGSIIYTDMWKGYSTVEFEANGFQHDTVNHSENFVDPVTGVHTNTIEGTWNGIKMKVPPRHRSMAFVKNDLLSFVWRRVFADALWDRFLYALKNVEYELTFGVDNYNDPR